MSGHLTSVPLKTYKNVENINLEFVDIAEIFRMKRLKYSMKNIG